MFFNRFYSLESLRYFFGGILAEFTVVVFSRSLSFIYIFSNFLGMRATWMSRANLESRKVWDLE